MMMMMMMMMMIMMLIMTKNRSNSLASHALYFSLYHLQKCEVGVDLASAEHAADLALLGGQERSHPQVSPQVKGDHLLRGSVQQLP